MYAATGAPENIQANHNFQLIWSVNLQVPEDSPEEDDVDMWGLLIFLKVDFGTDAFISLFGIKDTKENE